MPTFDYGTSINGNQNYNIGLDMDPALMNQAPNDAMQNVLGYGLMGGGGGGGFNVDAPQANAVTQQVTDEQLMSNQIGQLLSGDSAYMDSARQGAMDQAAARGMGNSSIAVGNARRAAIDRAAPIAQFDAGRYGSVADQNMAAQNQMEQLNAQNAAQLQSAGMQAAGANQRAEMQARSQLQQMLLGHQFGALDDVRRQQFGLEEREDQQAFQGGQAGLDRQMQNEQFWQGEMPLNWAGVGLNQNQQYLDSYNQSQQNFLTPINMIYSNPNLTGEQQNAAVENWMGNAGSISGQGVGMMPSWMQGFQPANVGPQAWQGASQLPPMPQIFGSNRGG